MIKTQTLKGALGLSRKPLLIIDTDPGVDDALAIMLITRSQSFDIQAITTVAGNSTIENTTRNANYLKKILNLTATSIYSGAAKPLKKELIQASVHGLSGLNEVDTSKIVTPITQNATQRIIELVRQNPNQITILAIGPLTNIAKAFIKDPELPKLIKQLVIMGGAINVPGNMSRAAEFNFFVDPDAAEIVISSDAPKILIPLDLCNQVLFKPRDIKQLQDSDLYKPIKQMLRIYTEKVMAEEQVKGAIIYDACAAYYLLKPQSFQLTPMDLVIETTGSYTAGMTIPELRSATTKDINVKVAFSVDQKKLINDFIRILK